MKISIEEKKPAGFNLLSAPPLIIHPVYEARTKQPKDYKKENQAILDLVNYRTPSGSKKLKGRPGWRIRRGDFGVIYEIQDDHLIIIVLDVWNRKDIYR